MKNKLLFYMSMGVILLAAFIMGYVLFFTYYPFRTVEYLNSPFPVLNANKTVPAGGELIYQVNYCRHTSLPSLVTRNLVNDVLYTLSDAIVNAPPGCNIINTVVKIPKDIISGKYVLKSTITWNINTFRSITVRTETEEFTVVGVEPNS
jgi:hypothetical protein